MKKNKRKKFVAAMLAGLFLAVPVQGAFTGPAALYAAQTTDANDSKLSAFDISPGTLNPAFSPDVLEYTASVDAGVTYVSVQAVPRAAGATIASVEGREVKPGGNTIKVTCSARDNTYTVYTIALTVGNEGGGAQQEGQQPQEGEADGTKAGAGTENTVQDTEGETKNTDTGQPDSGSKTGAKGSSKKKSSSQAPSAKTLAKLTGAVGADGTVTLNGASYQLSNNFSFASISQEIPQGFQEGSLQIGDATYQALCHEASGNYLVYMENTDGNGATGFYYYDKKQNAVERLKYAGVGENFVIFISAARQQLPAGYKETDLTMPSGKEAAAYQDPEQAGMEDYYLVYGMNSDGSDGWYLYDSKQGTYMRYVAAAAPQQEAPQQEEVQQRAVSIEKYNLLYNEYADLKQNMVRIIGVLAVVIVLLIIIFTAIVMRTKDDDDEEEAEETERRRVKKRSQKPEEAVSKSSLAAGRSMGGKASKGKAKKITKNITKDTEEVDGSDEKAPRIRKRGLKKNQEDERALQPAMQEKAQTVRGQQRVEAVQESVGEPKSGGRTQPHALYEMDSREPGSRTQPYAVERSRMQASAYGQEEGVLEPGSPPYPVYGQGAGQTQGGRETAGRTQVTQMDYGTDSQLPTYTQEDSTRIWNSSQAGGRMPYAPDAGRMQESQPGRMQPEPVAGGINGQAGGRMPYAPDTGRMQESQPGRMQADISANGTVGQPGRMQAETREGQTGQMQPERQAGQPGQVQPVRQAGQMQREMQAGQPGQMQREIQAGQPGQMQREIQAGRPGFMQQARQPGQMQPGDMEGRKRRAAEEAQIGVQKQQPDGQPYAGYENSSQAQQAAYAQGGYSRQPDRAAGSPAAGMDRAIGGASRAAYESSQYQPGQPYTPGGRMEQASSYETAGQPVPQAGAPDGRYPQGRYVQPDSYGQAGNPQPGQYGRGSYVQPEGPGSPQQAVYNDMAGRGPVPQDSLQMAAEKMRQSVQYTRRAPQEAAEPPVSKEVPEAEGPAHDPMDDWEVEASASSRRSHKKRRSLIDEDMEIMDLNDL